LLQLVCLLSIEDTESVQVLGAAHLELDNILAPLNLHRTSILPPGGEKEVLDLMDLFRLQRQKETITKVEQRYRMAIHYINNMAISIWEIIQTNLPHKLYDN
jgi:hypothetical protein